MQNDVPEVLFVLSTTSVGAARSMETTLTRAGEPPVQRIVGSTDCAVVGFIPA
jgi:hypothetical protein